eukprot:15311-Eustigmatos_ZCMA.PRE.1
MHIREQILRGEWGIKDTWLNYDLSYMSETERIPTNRLYGTMHPSPTALLVAILFHEDVDQVVVFQSTCAG